MKYLAILLAFTVGACSYFNPPTDTLPDVYRLTAVCSDRNTAVATWTQALADDAVSVDLALLGDKVIPKSDDCGNTELLTQLENSPDPNSEARKLLYKNALATVTFIGVSLAQSQITKWQEEGNTILNGSESNG